MTSKADFQALAEMHADDAHMLFRARRHTNAFHLAGLSIECALKALICDRFHEGVLPDQRIVQRAYSHKLEELVGLAGVKAAIDDHMTVEPDFGVRWSIVKNWSVDARYETISSVEAAELLEAAFGEGGVLRWIKTHW
jgi:hypothetical protein